MTADQRPTYVLTLSCHDVVGIVAAVSGFLSENRCFIIESAQFGDASTGRFFMRTEFSIQEPGLTADTVGTRFQAVATRFGMEWNIADKSRRMRTLVMVSQHGHCFNDILHRYASRTLPIDVVGVVSNHEAMRSLSEWHEIPYHYLPVTAESKAAQEKQVLDIVEKERVELVILARYMQVLSPALVDKLKGRAINIHHSFLPGFKGAKPYHQAYDRGVKIIGATAHYVSNELDEGPIIEQEVTRVDHTDSPEELKSMGYDIENLVLARAVKYHSEHRVLINGTKTVVFR
ncbi:MAG: formyltetrahydrofolate deformylase [Alphaproteobacteria bacterium]|nr:formyltetrahydrofolate deformylase [Alphaproteobacteria bacterium]